ncbi:MAG: transposase [Phycisphaeraceae bacterium]|nr:transposase [Phycisphaeraceae bacterium]
MLSEKNLIDSGLFPRKGIGLKKSRFTNEQITFVLRQAKSGIPVEEVCRKMGASQQTFYR